MKIFWIEELNAEDNSHALLGKQTFIEVQSGVITLKINLFKRQLVVCLYEQFTQK